MLMHFTPESYSGMKQIYGKNQSTVHSITYDSRQAKEHTAFVCVEGAEHDGHYYIKQAVENGAGTVVGTNEIMLKKYYQRYPEVSFVLVEDSPSAMSYLSRKLYNSNYKSLKTVAITGTNGKTTVTSFVRHLLNHNDISTGSIGTEGVWDHEHERDFPHSTHTTPEAPDLHYIFDQFVKDELEAVALEVTSIAVEKKRVEGVLFDVGVHTNLTPEHIDFHSSFAHYKQAKMKMFDQVKKAVVNKDDAGMGQDVIDTFSGPLLTYSLIDDTADVSAQTLGVDNNGTWLDVKVQGKNHSFHLPLFGDHNIANFLAALCACMHLDVPVKSVIKHAADISTPQGRLQFVETGADYKVILDFAHTPDALDNVIKAVKKMEHNKLILLIAGSGIRDRRQRPELSEIAEGTADHLIVAVEHPDRSDRKEILKDMLQGFKHTSPEQIFTELYRENGIHKALSLAEKGDIVLLTGLGILDHQVIEGEEIPYSEFEVIKSYFKKNEVETIN